MARAPTYITMVDHKIMNEVWEEKILPSGSFVKPIHDIWLPKHIKDSSFYRFIDYEKDTYVYCHFGIISIPWDIIREII